MGDEDAGDEDGQANPTQGQESGIANVLRKGGASLEEDERVGRELAWQREVKGEAAKVAAFKAQVVGLQSFRAFAVMKAKSPLIQLVHSIGQYYGFSGLAPELQDRFVGFMGDRTGHTSPTPVALPVRNAWDWARVQVCMDTAAFTLYYHDAENNKKMWIAPGGGVEERQLPRMLALPSFIARQLQEKGPCLPIQLYRAATEHMDGGESQLTQAEWKLVLDWSIAASQVDGGGSSVLALETEVVSLQDPEVRQWCENTLTRTLGQHQVAVKKGSTRGGGGGVGAASIERVATRVSQGVVSGLKALAPALALAASRARAEGGGDTDQAGGKMFLGDQIAALKGYCGVTDPAKIPDIWRIFQSTRLVATWRTYLTIKMNKWELDNRGGGIDQSPCFSDELFRAMAKLEFNPGEGIALYNSRQKGITILCCRPKTAEEVEDIREHEEAMAHTGGKMSYDEFRAQKKKGTAGVLATPPENYGDLLLCINTYCAFIHTMFGPECDHYIGLMEVRDTLLLKKVSYIRSKFTVEVCRRITWAIIDDGRAFFDTVMVEGHFDGSIPRPRWPTSNLSRITYEVEYAIPIQRPNFPQNWVVAQVAVGAQQQQSKGGTGGRATGAGGGVPMGGGTNTGVGTGKSSRGGNGGGGEEVRHPKIIEMMAPYIAAKGSTRVSLGDILTCANKQIRDLPMVPQGENGELRPVCWVWALGKCTFGYCRFRRNHVPREKMDDAFAGEVVRMLQPGVNECVRRYREKERGNGGGSPAKKLKWDDQQQA